MSTGSPSLGFRIAVVVGGAALVLGVVGAVMLALRSDAGQTVLGPGAYARVRLVGVPADARLEVVVRWTTADEMEVTQPARPLEASPDVFLLPPLAPSEVTVEVTDVATDPPRVLRTRRVDVDGRGEVTVDLGPP